MTTVAETNALTSAETKSLRQHESTIERGLSTFYEVGAALLGIRDGRLYRSEFKRFEDYCQKRWSMTRNYVNKIISASEAASDLGTNVPKPQTESHARPLSKVPRESRAEVWERVVETAPVFNGEPKITAKHVEKVVAEELEDDDETIAHHDYLNQEVPDKLVRVFEAEPLFDDAIGHSRALSNALKAISESPAGKFLNLSAVNRLIKEIRTAINESRPYALCPYCHGRKCSACAQSGVVPKTVLDQAH